MNKILMLKSLSKWKCGSINQLSTTHFRNSVGNNNVSKNRYLYNGKEQQDQVIGGMAFGWYDYGHRMYDPQTLRFMTVDWEAESFPWQTPYCYASNNPIKFIDILGDSATFNGAGAQNAINFLNTQLAGFYTFAMNANGVVSMTAVPQQNNRQNRNGQQGNQQGNQQNGQQNAPAPQMTGEQQRFANQLNTIINGNGMTTINMVNNDNNTLVGDITTHTIDVGDVQQFGSGQYVDQMGAFIHEANEQYNVQVVNGGQQTNALNWQAHRNATRTEGMVTGSTSQPLRPTTPGANGSGTVTVPVWDNATNQWHNVIVNYQNGNVTSITR